jgi:hypothetical protein
MAGIEPGLCYLSIFNIMGQTVKQTELKGSYSTINVLGMKEGIYFYRIVNSEGRCLKSGKLEIIH